MADESHATGSPKKILAVNEVIRERMTACSGKAFAQFKDTIRPVYGATSNGIPEQLGSCVLLQIEGKPSLMTAGHLLDSDSDTSLYIGGRDLGLIENKFSVSCAASGNRGDDRYDFAIAELTSEFVARLGPVRFIRDEDVSRSVAPTTGHLFSCIGFPNSQNRRVDPSTNKITPRRGRYGSNTAYRPALLAKLKISGTDHLIIDHRKHSKDDRGNRVSSYALPGFSGGAVIDLGKISSPEIASGVAECEPRLVGLFIEYYKDHQAIVATRIDTILKAYLQDKKERTG